MVSIEDFEKLDNFNVSWHPWFNKTNQSWYARATEYLGWIDGRFRNKTHYLQKFLIECDYKNEKICIDHINHNTLDNRRENLRITKINQNTKNRKGKNSNNSSGYRNVSFDKSRNKWIVQLQVNKTNKVLGEFDNVHEAGEFAEIMRQKYYGKFAGIG